MKVDHMPLLTPKSSSISLVRKNATEASIALPLREAKMLVRKEVFGKQ